MTFVSASDRAGPFLLAPVGYGATSATSVAVGTGSKTFTVTETGAGDYAYAAGDRLHIVSSSTGAWMEGVVTSYASPTLVVEVTATYGSGTLTDWSINLAGETGYSSIYGGVSNGKPVESHAGGDATFAVKTLAGLDPTVNSPVRLLFGDGTQRTLTSALSLEISGLKTLGTIANTPFRVWAVLYVDGTVKLGLIQTVNTNGDISAFPSNGILRYNVDFDTGGLTSGKIFVASIPSVDVPFAILGFAEYDVGLADPQAWNVAPDRIGLYGPHVKLPGQEVQTVGYQSGAYGSSTQYTTYPTAVPDAEQFATYLTKEISAHNAVNLAEVEALMYGYQAEGAGFLGAISRSGAAWGSVLATGYFNLPGAVSVWHYVHMSVRAPLYNAGSIYFYAQAVKVSAGSGYSLEINGGGGTRRFGGRYGSFLRITERMT